jgi:SAM-dependent methyltransferase
MHFPGSEPCRLCGAPSTARLFVAEGHAQIGLAQPFAYYACPRCGVHQLRTAPLDRDIYRAEKEATRATNTEGPHYVHWDDEIVRALGRRVRGRELLDFGSGYGDMLLAATRAGFRARGVDVSPFFAEQARRRSGCDVHVGSLGSAGFAAHSFDVINAHFVLEYVPDVVDTVVALGKLLAPGGVFRIFGYAPDSVPARVKGRRWWNYTPTRPFLFARKTIDYMARRAGLQVREIIVGGEQSLASHLDQQGAARKRWRVVAKETARYLANHVALGPLAVGSCRAYYLTRPS